MGLIGHITRDGANRAKCLVCTSWFAFLLATGGNEGTATDVPEGVEAAVGDQDILHGYFLRG